MPQLSEAPSLKRPGARRRVWVRGGRAVASIACRAEITVHSLTMIVEALLHAPVLEGVVDFAHHVRATEARPGLNQNRLSAQGVTSW
jgi:hypothetical protein